MDEPTRLTKTKEQWAKARRGGEEREVFHQGDDRLPPGQHLVDWPCHLAKPENSFGWKFPSAALYRSDAGLGTVFGWLHSRFSDFQ